MAEFGPRLPFLLKVLAADSPLSLQVHPTLDQARAGFAREEAAGVDRTRGGTQLQGRLPQAGNDPRADPVRGAVRLPARAPDPVPSSSMLAADFELAGLELPPLVPQLLEDLAQPEEHDGPPRSAFERLIAGGEDVAEATAAIVAALVSGAPTAPHQAELSTVVTLNAQYPGDPGVLISLLLNRISLAPGEAVYLPAGNVHAYLHGLGIEVMASSDNVLRGGLTPKFVDVPELLRTDRLRGRRRADARRRDHDAGPGALPAAVPGIPAAADRAGARRGARPAGAVRCRRHHRHRRIRPPRLPQGRAAAGTGRQRLPARRRGAGQRPRRLRRHRPSPGICRHHRIGSLTPWIISCRAPRGHSSSVALGRTVHEQSGPGWRFLAVEESNPAGKLLYSPYGPVADSLAAFDAALAALTDLARNSGAVFVRIEPVDAGFTAADADAVLRSRGLQPAPANQQPELSWIVDLDRDFKDVLADMKPVNRNLYRNIHKKGVTFRSSQDPAEISVLLEFLHMTAARNGFKPQSDEYLTQVARSLMPAGAATLFIAELDGHPIAAALAYDSADTRTYAHAALDDTHRKLSAGIPLLVTLIADAQDEGPEARGPLGRGARGPARPQMGRVHGVQEVVRRPRDRVSRNLGPAGPEGPLRQLPAGPQGRPAREEAALPVPGPR